MSVLERLVQGADAAIGAGARTDVDDAAESSDEGGQEQADEAEPKTASVTLARQILSDAPDLEAECVKIAAEIRGEMEKTAEEGGDASEGEGTVVLLEKIAQTLKVQRVYAENLRKQGEQNARTVEALKLASDLMQRDLLEIGEGQTMAQAVEALAKKDLKAVKVASEMFGDAALTNALGAAEKIASDRGPAKKLDGSNESWAEAHAWLFA